MANLSLKVITLAIITSFLILSRPAAADTCLNAMRTFPVDRLVNGGLDFNVSVTIDANDTIYMSQFFINYNPTVITVKSVSQGNLFVRAGYSTFPANYIDNVKGRAGFSNMRTPSTSGDRGNKTVAVITFHSRNSSGTSTLAFVPVISKLLNASGGLLSLHTADGSVTIRSNPGNVNNDFIVDGEDMFTVGKAFNSKPGMAAWNPNADLNEDGFIDLVDLSMVGIRFGEVISSVEICNGLDDDNDGLIDEDFTMLGGSCSAGTGECFSSGSMVCRPDGSGTECNAIPKAPFGEVCNDMDDDCDGKVDEDDVCGECGDGFCGNGENCSSCESDCGRCETCNDMDGDGYGSNCVSHDCDDTNDEIYPGAIEICDGKDNDCDAMTDEDFPGLGGSCSVGIGACTSSGSMVCRPDGSGTECDAIPKAPFGEVCNDMDDDCDGKVDEDGVCEIACFGIPKSDYSVCSGHGVCVYTDTCTCQAAYFGVNCSNLKKSPGALCTDNYECISNACVENYCD